MAMDTLEEFDRQLARAFATCGLVMTLAAGFNIVSAARKSVFADTVDCGRQVKAAQDYIYAGPPPAVACTDAGWQGLHDLQANIMRGGVGLLALGMGGSAMYTLRRRR
jgi:hypothetical protein